MRTEPLTHALQTSLFGLLFAIDEHEKQHAHQEQAHDQPNSRQ